MATVIQPTPSSAKQTAAVAVVSVAVLALLVAAAYAIPQLLDRFNSAPMDPTLDLYVRQAAVGVPAFPVAERAAATIRAQEGPAAMQRFLLRHVQAFDTDPHNGYFLILVAESYQSAGAVDLARDYYKRAFHRYPSITVAGKDTHFVALNRLLALATYPEERIEALSALLSRYADQIDISQTHFQLAAAYGAAQRWTEAFAHYRAFLARPETASGSRPQIRQQAEHLLAFHESPRDWTQPNLNDLVTAIKRSLAAQDTRALLRHRAKVGFFSMSWEQEQFDFNSQIDTFDIGAFLRASRVRFAENLDLASNAREAYLRTWGWSHRIPTWYLYFRRVDYPADPEIHGNWEWAGIYFGDVL